MFFWKLNQVRWCLNYISERKSQLLPRFHSIFSSLCTNIEKVWRFYFCLTSEKHSTELVHSSLLVLSELLTYGGEMVKPKEILTKVTLPVFGLREHKSPLIKQVMISLYG